MSHCERCDLDAVGCRVAGRYREMKRLGTGTAAAAAFFTLVLIASSTTPADAGKPTSTAYAIHVPDTTYAGYTVASVIPDQRQNYVFVQCYAADGTYVYAAWADVVGAEADIGPLRATTWPPE